MTMRAGNDSGKHRDTAPRPHVPQPFASIGEARTIEWHQEGRAPPAIRDIETDDVRVAVHAIDPPSLTPDDDGVVKSRRRRV
jgi:hypothetical protein